MLETVGSILNLWLIFVGIRVATPILIAAIGGLFTDLAGVINIALEGLMLLSALVSVMVSYYAQNVWLGVLAGVLASALLALVLAFFALKLRADIIIAGLAINLFASGFTVFLMNVVAGEKGNFTRSGTPALPNLAWEFARGVPVLDPLLNGPQGLGHNVLTYAGFAFVILSSILLYRTPFGLQLRAVGENAAAAASVGVPVMRIQLLAILLSGILSGFAGAQLSLGYLNMFVRDMTAGRGYIALAAILLGGRTPSGTMAAALFFGLAEGLATVLQALRLPSQLVLMIPYAATVAALVVFANRKKQRLAELSEAAEGV